MYSRRLFLQLGAAAVAGAPTPALTENTWSETFALLRHRWRELAAMEPARSPGANIPAQLQAMARSYLRTGDASLAEAVSAGIEDYVRRVYVAGAEPVGNWWNWQIGIPKQLLDAAVLVGSESAALRDAVDHFVPEQVLHSYSGTSTAANRVDLCLVMLLRAMLRSDPAKAALAVSALDPVFDLVAEGDGFHPDGSFIQHSHIPYQGTYGVTLLSGLATMFALLRGTPWELTSQLVFDSVEKTFAPFVHNGRVMDLVSGRAIGRGTAERRAQELARAVLLLGQSASEGERHRWQRLVTGWLDTTSGHWLFADSARAVHRRPGWCAALSMASHRIGHYEHGNGENLRGWHTGSGMLYWWANGHGEVDWESIDPYRLPGTTVSTKRLPDGAGKAWGDTRTPFRWVGGATDGTYAVVGQHLQGLESTLEAFKSWIFLDDAVICMGAGITSLDGVPYETVVEN